MAGRRWRKADFAMLPTASKEPNACSASPLADLPTELIWQIASYLKTPTLIRQFEVLTVRKRRYDLCALRCTCRTLHDKVQDVFLPTAFNTLEVDLTRSNLDILNEISEHSVCSTFVRELHFVMAEAWPDADDWSDEFEKEMLERNHIEKGTGAILLSRAFGGFSNLKAVKVQPVMWFPGNPRFILTRWPHGEGSTTSLVATILAALSLSDTRIETLAFTRQPPFTDDLNGPTGCYIPLFCIPSNSMKAFQNLRVVDLILAVRPSKRFDPTMASALTSFVSQLKQLVSLSVRFDSQILSEMVMRDFLNDCQVPTLTWFRLEVAFIWDTSSGCPLLKFLNSNKQIQHWHFSYVDLDEGRWAELFETLSTCKDLRTADFQFVTEESRAVFIDDNAGFRIEDTDDMVACLSKARRGIRYGNSSHDEGPAARYERYPDDSEYESSGED